jgi:hypothetical protein
MTNRLLRTLAVAGALLSTVALATLFMARGADAQGGSSVGNPALLAELQQLRAQVAPKKFYLTQATFDGAAALTACGTGFHVASLFEIFDPTNLKYDTALGFTQADSGSGPPSGQSGWIRTGSTAQTEGPIAGGPNCNVWSSNEGADEGTVASLSADWSVDSSRVSPWEASGRVDCHNHIKVWCVEDR